MSGAPISKATVIGEGKEQWLSVERYSCVHCRATFQDKDQLLRHYEGTRHDKYSAWK